MEREANVAPMQGLGSDGMTDQSAEERHFAQQQALRDQRLASRMNARPNGHGVDRHMHQRHR